MTDIAERLRGWMTSGDQPGADSYNNDLEEAAEEIERLLDLLAEIEARTAGKDFRVKSAEKTAEIYRLARSGRNAMLAASANTESQKGGK